MGTTQGPVEGLSLMFGDAQHERLRAMPMFLLHHQHTPSECAAAFAAWRGFDSPLRRHPAASTCLEGGHAVWWRVEASNGPAALALLPPYVASRTHAIAVRDVQIP